MNTKLPREYQDFLRKLDSKDSNVLSHMSNVANHMVSFVVYLHEWSMALDISIQDAHECGIYHDIGKWYLTNLTTLPRRLSHDERDQIKKHSILGLKVAEHYGIINPYVLDTIKYHHEDYTGNGYPDGLDGEDIPLIARIASICDVYEALYAKRHYKTNLPYEQVKIIMDDMRHKFDPKLFDMFFEMMDERILKNGNK